MGLGLSIGIGDSRVNTHTGIVWQKKKRKVISNILSLNRSVRPFKKKNADGSKWSNVEVAQNNNRDTILSRPYVYSTSNILFRRNPFDEITFCEFNTIFFFPCICCVPFNTCIIYVLLFTSVLLLLTLIYMYCNLVLFACWLFHVLRQCKHCHTRCTFL